MARFADKVDGVEGDVVVVMVVACTEIPILGSFAGSVTAEDVKMVVSGLPSS